MEDRKRQHALHTRDPFLVRLAALSPTFAEGHAQEAPAVRKVREKCQREILRLPGVKSRLEKLRAKGIKPERVLVCLAALVQLEKDATWKSHTKEIKRALAKLGRRLWRIAGEVERIYSNDAIRPDLYALSLGFLAAASVPHDPRKTVERMHETVADLEAKAAAFGNLRKEIIPAVRRAPVVALLRHVSKPQPWSVPALPLELGMILAELLDAVCEKYGIENSFTPDSLLKTFERHVLRPS